MVSIVYLVCVVRMSVYVRGLVKLVLCHLACILHTNEHLHL